MRHGDVYELDQPLGYADCDGPARKREHHSREDHWHGARETALEARWQRVLRRHLLAT